jgi:peptidoglycan hydrolase-like protein with peptidoglycan-binding domain
MKKLLLAGVAVVSIAAFAPANAQQTGSAKQPVQQSSNVAGQSNAARPNQGETKQAQQALGQKGFHVRADGLMGPQTKQALTQFQQKQGLQQTGQLDEQTMAALGISQSTTGQGGSSTNGANPQPQQPSQQPSSGMKK